MKYLIAIPALILASSAAFADPPVQANDKQNGVNEQTLGMHAPDNSQRNITSAQGNILTNVSQLAVAPSGFLSAPQYQPHPLQQNHTSPLYSLSVGLTNN